MVGDDKNYGWIDFLAWMEIVAGVVGLIAYVVLAVKYPPNFNVSWHNVLAVAFFGANIVAGILLRERRAAGFTSSFLVQLMQVLVLNLGTAVVLRAGIHFTFVLSSSGGGVLIGPASVFLMYPSTSGFDAPGLGFHVTLGWWLRPLQNARWAVGVNLLALYFANKLWRYMRRPAVPVPAPEPAGLFPAAAAPAPHAGRWRWLVRTTVAATIVIAVWMALDGPRWGYAPVRRWPLATGDTADILAYTEQYDAHYILNDRSVRAQHYLLIRFRSPLSDPDRDHANVLAVLQLVCRVADSMNLRRILIQPTNRGSSGIVSRSTYTSHWFDVGAGANCTASSPP